jgi:hypothetical protein
MIKQVIKADACLHFGNRIHYSFYFDTGLRIYVLIIINMCVGKVHECAYCYLL